MLYVEHHCQPNAEIVYIQDAVEESLNCHPVGLADESYGLVLNMFLGLITTEFRSSQRSLKGWLVHVAPGLLHMKMTIRHHVLSNTISSVIEFVAAL